jgi:hypothetical protein
MHGLDANDPRWQSVQEVVQSPQFEKAPRLRSFLLFVCEMELTGRRSEINEQEIGVKVFGRSAGYSPGEDSIVRSQARILRHRLSEYFEHSRTSTGIRITIPKGTYAPTFESVEETQPGAIPADFAAEPAKRSPFRPWLFTALLAIPLALLFVWGAFTLQHRQRQATPEARFWDSLFAAGRTAVIVPADSTLVLIEELTNSQVNFEDYQSRKYLATAVLNQIPGNLRPGDLDESRYTSMADLNLVAQLMRVPQIAKALPKIRYARDLSISDARESNLILIGGARANPWVQLFAGHMNFTVDYDWQKNKNMVVNRHPAPGESPFYLQDAADPQNRLYGLVAYEPSLDGEGNCLLVSGTSSAATQAAADFLLSNHLFSDFLHSIGRPDGSIPHFELLLSARDLNGSVAESAIVASRLSH